MTLEEVGIEYKNGYATGVIKSSQDPECETSAAYRVGNDHCKPAVNGFYIPDRCKKFPEKTYDYNDKAGLRYMNGFDAGYLSTRTCKKALECGKT